jgi:hypothetical protein
MLDDAFCFLHFFVLKQLRLKLVMLILQRFIFCEKPFKQLDMMRCSFHLIRKNALLHFLTSYVTVT